MTTLPIPFSQQFAATLGAGTLWTCGGAAVDVWHDRGDRITLRGAPLLDLRTAADLRAYAAGLNAIADALEQEI